MYTISYVYFLRRLIKVLFILIYTFHLAACLPITNNGNVFPTPITSRQIGIGTLPLYEKWRISDPSIVLITANFFTNGDQLIYIDYPASRAAHWITVLDTQTGSLLWKTDPLPFNENAIAVDNQTLYVLLSPNLHAYNLVTGELAWKTTGLPTRTSHRMYIEDDKLIVYSAENASEDGTLEVARTYIAKSGELESTNNYFFSKGASFILKTSLNNYWSNSSDYWSDPKSIWSVSRQTGLEQWSLTVTGPVRYSPLLIDGRFIFASGLFSDIIAVDEKTGDRLWQYEKKIISNLATDSGVIYAVREDAALVAINAYNGEEIGFVSITPSFTEETGSRSIPYYVTAAKGMVIVYYGDSQEIIAFQSK